jgi:peptidyl-prolyl cis-trans isomerase D
MRPQLVVPARRTARVATAPDEAKARALAEKWRAGADWDAIAAAAQADGGAGIPLDDVVDAQIPDRDLAKAVFAAPLDAVTDPVKGALSWYVVRVSAATAGEDPDFDAARERVREKVAADKAADLMYERANKVDALLANGVSLEDMPGDLGLVGIAGTLDRDGMTPENELAPIPGAAELRAALIEAAFATQQGDPPRLTEVRTPSLGGTAYYALSVEAVTPTVLRPLAEVKDRAIEDWRADRQRKHQEEAAAKMLAAVKSGQAFADAATVAGAPERVTPLATRAEAPEGVPPELLRAIFALKPGEPTMVETAEAFVVAALEQALDPDPKNDPDGYAQARAAVGRGVAQDIGATYLEALRLRANPRIDQKNLDRVVQP